MIEQTKLEPCPLCHSPHINIARNLKGNPRQAFCKVCGCQAPLPTWQRRSPAPAGEGRRLALEKIAAGAFEGVIDMVMRDDWKMVVESLQGIARAALSSGRDGKKS